MSSSSVMNWPGRERKLRGARGASTKVLTSWVSCRICTQRRRWSCSVDQGGGAGAVKSGRSGEPGEPGKAAVGMGGSRQERGVGEGVLGGRSADEGAQAVHIPVAKLLDQAFGER